MGVSLIGKTFVKPFHSSPRSLSLFFALFLSLSLSLSLSFSLLHPHTVTNPSITNILSSLSSSTLMHLLCTAQLHVLLYPKSLHVLLLQLQLSSSARNVFMAISLPPGFFFSPQLFPPAPKGETKICMHMCNDLCGCCFFKYLINYMIKLHFPSVRYSCFAL